MTHDGDVCFVLWNAAGVQGLSLSLSLKRRLSAARWDIKKTKRGDAQMLIRAPQAFMSECRSS